MHALGQSGAHQAGAAALNVAFERTNVVVDRCHGVAPCLVRAQSCAREESGVDFDPQRFLALQTLSAMDVTHRFNKVFKYSYKTACYDT